MESPVAIVRCGSYDEEEVLAGLQRSIDLIGGIGAFVKSQDRVLLKPNLLYGRAPEKAVTTHPSIIRGMIRIVRDAGGVPFIGDSPSLGCLSRAAEKSGIKRVADKVDCPLVEFDRPVFPQEGRAKLFRRLEIDRSVLEADVVINLPKWKTHGMTLLTLGIKNLFGCVPGPRKALWHLKAGEDRKRFAQMLVDLYQTIHPSLTILDGILGMEGNGPGSGHPISLGLILASGDPLNLDQIVCDLLGIPRTDMPTNRVAFEEGLGQNGIDVVGEKVEEARVPRFELPPLCDAGWNLPGFLRRALKNALSSKPVVEEELCRVCRQCEEICPPKALKRRGEKLVFDYKGCIRCFCCQEICPEGAISIKPGWAQHLISRKSKCKIESN
jgi:uncharacterized protein (DUF362 family)/Pyruvate/2-oxoacid:ferredoxin oxidoreductase delta subunit